MRVDNSKHSIASHLTHGTIINSMSHREFEFFNHLIGRFDSMNRRQMEDCKVSGMYLANKTSRLSLKSNSNDNVSTMLPQFDSRESGLVALKRLGFSVN